MVATSPALSSSSQAELLDDSKRRDLRLDVATPASKDINSGGRWNTMRSLSFLPRWLSLVKGWYIGTDRRSAWKHALPCVVLAICKTFLIVKISYVQRRFSTNLSEKNPDGFYAAVWEFVGIILLAAPMFSAVDFATDMLKVSWRKWMTEQVLTRYFAKEAYFQLKSDPCGVDNPDQRICDDIASFTSGSTVIMMTAMDKLFQVLAVLKVLWDVSPGLVLFIILYTSVGTLVTVTGFGQPLMRLFYEMLHREGDMRFTLVRVSENAESIAFYGGASREAGTVRSRLTSLVDITVQRLWWLAGLGFWSNCYGYATILVPSLMIGPRYFRGEVDFGTISQASYLFNRLVDALSAIIDRLHSICNLAAETDRLYNLNHQIDDLSRRTKSIIHMRSKDVEGLSLEDVTITTPKSTLTLARSLSLKVDPGQSLLIMGASGCGKSSLMRAVSGLWSHGSGTIRTPQTQDLFFLPQKPYMPLGSLREQLLFPSGLQDDAQVGPGQPLPVQPSDRELISLLEEVHLSHLPLRSGGLDADLDWAGVLSQGEQQRVAFLRLLLHRPVLAFLDEATSALDNHIEAELYLALQRHSRCYISIGHRLQLVEYHTHVLLGLGEGKWELMSAQQYKKRFPTATAAHH